MYINKIQKIPPPRDQMAISLVHVMGVWFIRIFKPVDGLKILGGVGDRCSGRWKRDLKKEMKG